MTSNQTPREASPGSAKMDTAASISISPRQPNRSELDRVNDIIAAAMQIWKLPERVKRISLPLYRYQENDLEHMHFLIAETGDTEIVGLAALEEIDATAGPGGRPVMLLHGLYVNPAHHRRGIGTRLLDSAEDFTQAHSVAGLLVRAQTDALPFFEKRGFAKLPVENDSRNYAHRYWKSIQPAILSPL